MRHELSQCMALSNGSRFYRGDLHIHSYGGSHDVKDTGMRPQEIVNTAIREGLSIIAVSDHNEISNVQATVDAGNAAGIFVVPAVELSTPEGHLLCYFPSIEALAQFHGRLDLADRGLSNSRCRNSMHACLNMADELGGFCILAHVDGGNGLETNDPGASPHKLDIICHVALLGIELKSVDSPVRYSPEDTNSVRAQIGKQRIDRLGHGERQYLARILNSDSHTLNALGRNAVHDHKLTRYKMASPTFNGLRLALEESDSRIRLEDEIPTATPFILGAVICGGFLDGQSIHFSSNLNCIIGGRGTGKSTTFEAVRCLTGTNSDADVVDSEVWPQQLYLFWQDEAGQRHAMSRPMGNELTNLDNPLDGPIAFEVDCFGQGEAARVREHAKGDPLALMKYLDTFTQVGAALLEEQKLCARLQELRTRVIEAEKNVAAIPQTQRTLTVLQQQLKAFEALKGSEIIKLQRNLATEKSRKENLREQLTELKTIIEDTGLSETALTLRGLVAADDIVIGKAEAADIAQSVDEFIEKVKQANATIAATYQQLSRVTTVSLSQWKLKEQPILDDIEQKRKELEKQGVKLDMSHVTKLAADEAKHQKDLNALKT